MEAFYIVRNHECGDTSMSPVENRHYGHDILPTTSLSRDIYDIFRLLDMSKPRELSIELRKMKQNEMQFLGYYAQNSRCSNGC